MEDYNPITAVEDEWPEDDIDNELHNDELVQEAMDTKMTNLWEEIEDYLRSNYARNLRGDMTFIDFDRFICRGN